MSALVSLAGRLAADALAAWAKGEALPGFAPLHAALEAGEGAALADLAETFDLGPGEVELVAVLLACATSAVTVSAPSTSTIAANRCSCTIGYWSAVTPSEACLCPMRDSNSAGCGSAGSTRWAANVAIDAASARCCAPWAWFPLLNRLRSSSGCAANIRR